MSAWRILTAAVLFGAATLATAEEGNPPARVQVHGFVTQGYFKTDENNYFGDSQNGSFEFSELGLQLTADITNSLRFSTLFLARDAGATDNGSLRVDHALVEWRFLNEVESQAGILLGRLKQPFGFYNETRDVANTRPSILLPQSIYFDNARKYLINVDGAHAYYQIINGRVRHRFNVAYGKQPGIDNPETEAYLLGADLPGSIDSTTGYGIGLEHNVDNGRTVIKYGYGRNDDLAEYKPAAFDFFGPGHIDFKGFWLSGHHDIGPFGLTSELWTAKTEYEGFGLFFPDRVVRPLGVYGQVSFRQPSWELFVRRDIGYLNRSDKSGEEFQAATGVPAYNAYAKDWTFGGRYYFTPATSLSAEVHDVDGTLWLPAVDNPDILDRERRWRIFAVQFSYSF